MALDAGRLQQAVNPEPVEPRLLDRDDADGYLGLRDLGLSCKTHRVVRVADERDAYVEDEQTGEIAGRICAEAFGWAKAEPNRPKPWRILSHASPDGRCILIPLAGDVLMQHAPLRRIADYGHKVAAGAVPELAALEALDTRVAQMQKRQREIRAEALAAATAGFDVPDLERRNAIIVQMMKTHDWTWREADRFYQHCADHEDRMLAALAEIPEAETAALWHLHAPVSYWSWSSARQRIARKLAA